MFSGLPLPPGREGGTADVHRKFFEIKANFVQEELVHEGFSHRSTPTPHPQDLDHISPQIYHLYERDFEDSLQIGLLTSIVHLYAAGFWPAFNFDVRRDLGAGAPKNTAWAN